MGRKNVQTAGSKISSASAPAVAAGASTRKSSVLKSAFAPTHLQLHLFASVIQSFDSQQLRIHDTATGRLCSQHEVKGSKIQCLDWGYYGAAYRERQQQKKKRKRDHNSTDEAVVAFGTNTSRICMYSPAEGRVVGTLTGGHERGIKDFRFSVADPLQGWSIGQDGKLVQWDLMGDQPIRTINLPDPAIDLLASPSQTSPQILCASSTPFAIDFASSDDFRIDRFDSFKNPIHSLCRSSLVSTEASQYFLAADSDRYVNVYSVSQKKLVRTLVASSGVTAVSVSTPLQDTPDFLRQQMLCIVTKDGTIELFSNPFTEPTNLNGDLKSSRKNLTRKASASVRLVSSDPKSKLVPIVAAFVQGPDLILVSADGGVDLAFERVRWQDEGNGELLFDGEKQVVRARRASTLNTATLNGVKDLGKARIDESRTVVVNGGANGPAVADAIEISSSEDEDEEEEDDSTDEKSIKEEDGDQDDEGEESASVDTGIDEEMVDAGPTDATEVEVEDDPTGTEEPSFGDLLASRHPTEISISAALPDSNATALTVPKANPLSLPSGMSLGTVLTQALRTNDTPLLETCLHTLDTDIVRSTIQRLDSSLAGVLLSRLAERLASRPGRYGHLITWVQWTCIAHGGAVASQPDVTAKIKSLYGILNDRMRTLDDLLLLKGKLDLLGAQLQFRRQMADRRGAVGKEGRGEPGVIYVEGAQDNWDSDDDLDEDGFRASKRVKNQRKELDEALADREDDEESEEDEDDEALQLANGVDDLSSDEEEEDDSEGLDPQPRLEIIDDEASVSEADESDPDDLRQSPARSDASSAASSDDEGSEEDLKDDDDEEDSELESFINDGSVDFEEEAADEIHVGGDSSEEDEDEEVAIPVPVAVKKMKIENGDAMDIDPPRAKKTKTSPNKPEKKPKSQRR